MIFFHINRKHIQNNVTFNNKTILKLNIGKIGTAGKGGPSGKTAKNGYNVAYRSTNVFQLGFYYHNIKDLGTLEGTKGNDGYSSESIRNPYSAGELINPSHSVNGFKNYARENLVSNIRESNLRLFLKDIDTSTLINSLYDTLGLVNDLQGMESQFFSLRKVLSFKPFIDSLLNRIHDYAQIQKNKDDKKVLSYLYTAALSKRCAIRNHINYISVVNLLMYLDSVKEDIEKFHEVDQKVVVLGYKNQYKSSLEEKIKVAQKFIDDQVNTEINKIFNKTEDQILLLIKETIKKQDDTKVSIKKNKAKAKELKGLIVSHAVINILKTVGSALSLLGPVGAGVGSAIGAGASVAEVFVGEFDMGKIDGVSKSVTDSIDKIEAAYEKKPFKKKTVETMFGSAGTAGKVFQEIEKDAKKMDEVRKTIENLEGELYKLNKFEQNIYDKMVPELREIKNTINEMNNGLKGKAHFELDISKWRIQETLEDVKRNLVEITAGFKVQDNLKRCMEKLQESMNIMIDIYDRIDAYADNGKLADYMANIASSGTVLAMDDTMKEAVSQLDRIIQTNIILEQYEIVIHSFKQHEFPFALKYMNYFDLPADLQFNDTDTLTQKSVSKIEYLSREIKKWKASSGNNEIQKFSNIEYNSVEKRFSPFYVWKVLTSRMISLSY